VSETGDAAARRGFLSRLFGRGSAEPHSHRSISKEEALAHYLIREHRAGRPLNEILEDPYLKNRASDEQRLRLLERPDVIHAVGEHTAALAAEQVRDS
jgi:hypothetical protein